jgi:hypothetical protein
MIPLEINALLAFIQQQGHAAEIQAETNQIYFPLKAKEQEFPVFMRIFDESGLLQILAFFPCSLEKNTIADTARLLHMFNKELDLPGFGMDELSGVVFFRWMMPTDKKKVSEELLANFITTLKTVCQTFSTVIRAVAAGAVTFEVLLEKAKSKK